MFKRILLAAGASAVLLTGACSSGTEPDDGCTELFNTRESSRGDTIVTTTGLRYIDLVQGTGATVVSCRRVLVYYRGILAADNTEFAPRALLNPPFAPGRNEVIDGFEQGVIGMRVGGKRRLIIPPSLGYGSTPRTNPNTGAVVIPANSTLIFDIEAQAVEQ
ncbi:MAG: FKBP-type peptidyl-prolyl cis-trans isomerase [Gemmatimonadetes bacterium]|nr:FKBP-type peptidyl-prolyl cis-trans isomerase [Gemmatimonadota bacterium]